MSEVKRHLIESLNKGFRFDERKLDEFRKIEIEKDISKSAEGSARVRIGKTEVLVGVKMGIDKPYPDTPDEGCMMVGAELLPLSSPEFELGPPGMQAIELARVVDRGVREAKAINVKKLCIEKGEKVWIVFIDVCTINDDGNLLDAAGIAALAALENTRLPKQKDGKIDYKEKTKEKLPFSKLPIPVTVHKIGNNFIVDPSTEEEKASDARLTVTSTDETICALQKGGDSPLMIEDIKKMVELAIKKGKEIRKLL